MAKFSHTNVHNFIGAFANVAAFPNASVTTNGIEVGDIAFSIADGITYNCTDTGLNLWTPVGGPAVTSVGTTAPIQTTGGLTPTLSIDAATTLAAGSMSASDKTKLDGIASGATATPLTASAPASVTKAAAAVGVSTDAARADHKHDITTAAPSSVGTSNTEGTSTALARADHVHNHGNQAGGSLHADAVYAGAAGFMTGQQVVDVDVWNRQWERQYHKPTWGYADTGLYQKEDFLQVDNLRGYKSSFSGAGAQVTQQGSTVTGRQGIARYETGNTATGVAAFGTDTNVFRLLNGVSLRGRCDVYLPTAGTALQDYICRVGYMDSFIATPNNGYYFEYNYNVNGGRWQLVQMSGGAPTTADSGWGLSVGNYQGLEIFTADDVVDFYYSGISVGQLTGYLSFGVGFGASIIKSVGTTSRYFEVDLAYTASTGASVY